MSAEAYVRDALLTYVSKDVMDTVIEYLSIFASDEAGIMEMIQFIIDTAPSLSKAEANKIIRTYVQSRIPSIKAMESNLPPTMTKNNHQKSSLLSKSSPSITIIDDSNEDVTQVVLASYAGDESKVGKQLQQQEFRCGCFATRHRFIASCIGCGRISCEKEGFGLCLHCSIPILAPISAEELGARGVTNVLVLNAYKHKDKLLVFDKENTKRTQVYDAQGDYYESTAWLTEEEKAAMDVKEKVRKQKLHQRRLVKMNINLQSRKLSETEIGDDDDDDDDDEIYDSLREKLTSSVVTAKSTTSSVQVPQKLEIKDQALDKDEDLTMDAGFSIENFELGRANSKVGSMYRALRKR